MTPDGYVTDEAQLLSEIRGLLASADAKLTVLGEPPAVKVRLEFGNSPGDLFTEYLRKAIRVDGGPPGGAVTAIAPDGPRWVLVKGYHDSGTIDDVFGPYTEEHANWLLRRLLDCSTYNWTMVKLSTGPEGT